MSQKPKGRKPQGRRPRWLGGVSASITALLLVTFLAPMASAQEDLPEPVDTDGDGQRDDWDGDGEPDNNDDLPCEWDDNDSTANDGVPDGIPDVSGLVPGCEGEGGTLPEQLSLQTVSVILSEVFAIMPDITEPDEVEDSFPNIRRLLDDDGNDIGPDWAHLDDLIGDPGVRDLLQLPDDQINQALLENEDLNNVEFQDPLNPDAIILVATEPALAHTLNQINRARGDMGLTGGSGSELRGPCMGMAWSYDADGQPLDVAWDFDIDGPPIGFKDNPDPDDELPLEPIFNSENPFAVHVDGAVIYTGLAGGVPDGTGPLKHDWFIELNFLGFAGVNIDAGGDPNDSGENRNLGAVNLNEDLPAPAKISGLVAINGQMDAPENGTGVNDTNDDVIGNGLPFLCLGSGFVDFQGGIPLTAPGVALVFLSTVGMLFNARPAKTFGGV
ncbi:MAG: hypothetical protein ACI9C1_003553 [Candidatus Aldehydirespiratoraceae bacterium]|jgi:hypothetical protein